MKIVKVGFKNFRSIGDNFLELDWLKKVHVVAGCNNAGKSNVLRALSWLNHEKLDPQSSVSALDRHKRNNDLPISVRFYVEIQQSDELPASTGQQIWFQYDKQNKDFICVQSPITQLPRPKFNEFMSKFTHQHFTAEVQEEKKREALQKMGRPIFQQISPALPEFRLIPEFRQITPGEFDLAGTGVGETLLAWQNPAIGKDQDQILFQNVQAFLRQLLRLPNATLEVSTPDPSIIVQNAGLRLPLKSYGTGIHQLIILAVALNSQSNVLFGIEEPEIHLHPVLQKELLNFLVEKTTNRYVFTTHSQSLIAPGEHVAVTHVWIENGETRSRLLETTRHGVSLLNDLGVRASDLLQANSVIWVEGPSDRIYLNRWIQLLDAGLKEGIDYSIMFYGGKLLSHVTLDCDVDANTGDLIELLKINQNSAILIDSDRTHPDDAINQTKARIKEECEKNGIICWITQGREVENYLPNAAVADAYHEIAELKKEIKISLFVKLEDALTQAYGSQWKNQWSYSDHKPSMARKIAPRIVVADIGGELKERVSELLGIVHTACGRSCPRVDLAVPG